jgi:hypothetical protein
VTTLVDPTAAAHQERPTAAGLRTRRPRVGLVDGMLHKVGRWGQGMLDAAQAVLAARLPGATFGRESLNPLDNPPPQLWAAHLAARYDAVVMTGGDCLTCVSRGVRDAIWAEIAGMPSVVICPAAVEPVVRQVCACYGMAGLPVCLVAESLFGRSRAEIARLVTPYLADLPEHLLRQ